MKVRVSSQFEKNYKKIPKEMNPSPPQSGGVSRSVSGTGQVPSAACRRRVKEKAKQKELIFRGNPFDSRLKTHKLSGENKECRAFSVDYSYRIKFIFLNNEEILFLDIGTHEIYKF